MKIRILTQVIRETGSYFILFVFSLLLLNTPVIFADTTNGIFGKLSRIYSPDTSTLTNQDALFLAIQNRENTSVFVKRLGDVLEIHNFDWELTVATLHTEYLNQQCGKVQSANLAKNTLAKIKTEFEKDLTPVPKHCSFISSAGTNSFSRVKQLTAEIGCTVRDKLQNHDVDRLISAMNHTWSTQYFAICQSHERNSALSETIEIEVNLNLLLTPDQFNNEECRKSKRKCTKKRAISLIKHLENARQHPAQINWSTQLRNQLSSLCGNKISCLVTNDSKKIAQLTVAMNVIENLDTLFLSVIDKKVDAMVNFITTTATLYSDNRKILPANKSNLENKFTIINTILNNLSCDGSLYVEDENNTYTNCSRLDDLEKKLSQIQNHISSLAIYEPKGTAVGGCGHYVPKGYHCP